MASRATLAAHPVWSVCACVALSAPGAAWAQSSHPYTFAVRPRPVADALIEFAVQADISIGGVNACRGISSGLNGRFSVTDGLARVLSGSDCDFRRVAPETFQVFVKPPVRRPAAVGAEPPSAPPPAPLESDAPVQVAVTATKRVALIGALPYAISALGRQQLAEAGAQDIGDVAAQIPGLSTTNLGLGRDKILLRGLSDGVFTGRTQSTVGIYLDDTPITYNAPDPDLQLVDVQSVEVLRGPQGALYGGGSMSGVYHIVTRKPVLDAWSSSVSAGGSLTEVGAPSQEFEGMANIPLVKGRTALRVVGYQTVLGGYIDDTDLRLSNIDKTVREGARAALTTAVGEDWLATLSVAYQSIKSDAAQYVTPGGGRLHRANQILESSQNAFSQATLNIEHSDFWGHLKSTTSYVEHRFSSQADASNALPLFGAGAPAVGSFDEPIDIRMVAEDAVFTSPSVGRFQWLAGLYASSTWEASDSRVRAAATGPNPSETLYDEHRTDLRLSGAFYGDASYAVTPRLTATVGLRLSAANVQTQSSVQAPQQGQGRLFASRTAAGGYSPKLALAYKASENATIYVVASQGRRGGGVNTGGPIGLNFVTASNASGVHQRFGSDQLWNFETGAKLNAFGGRLTANADLFYDVWSNIQTDQFMPSGLSYTANAGDGRNYGAELELVARPMRGLTLQATALVNQPELTHAAPGFVAGANLPGVPDLSLGGRAAYRWRILSGLDGLVSAEASYVGRSHLTFNSRAGPTMGGYVLGRLSAQLQASSWRLALYLSNPANVRGNTFSYGNPFNFQQAQELTPQRPRTLRAVLSKTF